MLAGSAAGRAVPAMRLPDMRGLIGLAQEFADSGEDGLPSLADIAVELVGGQAAPAFGGGIDHRGHPIAAVGEPRRFPMDGA